MVLLERMIDATGGLDAWDRTREIGWLETTVTDARVEDVTELVIDRAGGRFRLVNLAGDGVVTVVVGAISGERGHAYRVLPSGCLVEFMRANRARLIAKSAARARQSAFELFLPFSLSTDSVRLQIAGERSGPRSTRTGRSMRYVVLGVRRERGPELDIVVDKASSRPVLIERRRRGSLIGTRVAEWRPAGSLELATRRTDVASSAGAVSTSLVVPPGYKGRVRLGTPRVPLRGTVTIVSQVEVHAEVDDSLFSPPVAP